jgi:hypothetical protein
MTTNARETVVIADVEMALDTDADRDAAVQALEAAGEDSATVYYGTGEDAAHSGRELRLDGSIYFIQGR